MTASDANLVGRYDQGLGVQPDVVEAHMWLTAPTRTRTPRGISEKSSMPS